jgi:hypothetical protein
MRPRHPAPSILTTAPSILTTGYYTHQNNTKEFHFPMASDDRLRRFLYGIRRQFQDIPARSARARETALRHRPWERGRIGKIEERIRRETMFAGKLEFTTGELARLVYCNPAFDVDFNLRKKGDPPPKLKSWQYDRIRRAAWAFADRVGRSNTRGNPYLWRVRDEFWDDVRRRKSARKYRERNDS